MSTEPAKKGFFGALVGAVTDVVDQAATGLDSIVTTVAETVGKALPSKARAEVEEVADDIVDGFKADDVAATTVTPAPVAAPAAPAPAAPASS